VHERKPPIDDVRRRRIMMSPGETVREQGVHDRRAFEGDDPAAERSEQERVSAETDRRVDHGGTTMPQTDRTGQRLTKRRRAASPRRRTRRQFDGHAALLRLGGIAQFDALRGEAERDRLERYIVD
jgi:hypothetical protein